MTPGPTTRSSSRSTAPHVPLPDVALPPFRLIAGLGNPGKQYARTRHNVGFRVLDLLAQRWGVTMKSESRWTAEVGRAATCHLCKPQTFMNRSGLAIAALAQFHQIPPAETLVVYDDLALPLGRLRIRPAGSAGGHNGLADAILHLGTEAIPRLRIGVGAPEGETLTGHVLGHFRAEEIPALEESLVRAADAIEHAQKHGLASAMNQFNQAN